MSVQFIEGKGHCLIFRGEVLLAEYNFDSENHKKKALECLRKLQIDSRISCKFSYPSESYTINFITDNGFTYMLILQSEMAKTETFAVLERIKKEFNTCYKNRTEIASEDAFTHDFRAKFETCLQMCTKSNIDPKSNLVKARDQVIEIVTSNIEKALQSADKCNSMNEAKLQNHVEFNRNPWNKNFVLTVIVLSCVIILLLIVIGWLATCPRGNCN